MMESFLSIGRILQTQSADADRLSHFLNKVPNADESRQDRLVVILDVQTKPKLGLRIEPNALDVDRALEYAWVQDRKGPMSLKMRLTHQTLTTVLGEGIWTVGDEAKKLAPDSFLAKALAELEESCFANLEGGACPAGLKEKRRAWILDLHRLDDAFPSPGGATARTRNDYGAAVEEVILRRILGKAQKPLGSRVVYTLAVNGRHLTKEKEYREILAADFDSSERTGNGARKGGPPHAACTICGSKPALVHPNFVLSSFTSTNDPLFWNLTKTTTESKAPRLALCPTHDYANRAGQSWIQSNLRTSIAGEPVLIVPAPTQSVDSEAKLKDLANWVKGAFGTLENWAEAAAGVEELAGPGLITAIDVAFIGGAQKGTTKFRRVVPHIPPQRIHRLLNSRRAAQEWATDRWGIERSEATRFPGLSFLKEVYGKGSVGRRLDAVGGILRGRGVPEVAVLQEVLLSSEVLLREEPKKPYRLDGHLAKTMGMFHFLEGAMGDWRMKTMTVFDDLPEDKRAMVAFGRLLAQARSLQRKKAERDTLLGYVDFRGMSSERVERLAVLCLEKAQQLEGPPPPWMEQAYKEAMELSHRKGDAWALTDQENVALVLWGMADERLRPRREEGSKAAEVSA